MTEWFRRTTWTEQDRAEFFARLKRSRSVFHKAQYLRIQAAHLCQVGDTPCLRAALDLVDLMLAEYPDTAQLAAAHAQRATCLVALGERAAALVAYRNAVDTERRVRGIRPGAYIGFAELVVELERDDLYAEVLSLLNEHASDEPFPLQRYRSSAVRAFIAERQGRHAEAQGHALAALDAAAETQSPMRYHRSLGLVTDRDSTAYARLLALAGRTH